MVTGKNVSRLMKKIYISAVSDGIVTRKTSGGDVTLYLKNAHGDVTGATDESGSISAITAMTHLEIRCPKHHLIHSATAANILTAKAVLYI